MATLPVITATGIVSPVGYSAAECSAAVRAGLAGFSEFEPLLQLLQEDLPDPDDPVVASIGQIPDLDSQLPPLERCRQLASRALSDTLLQLQSRERNAGSITLLFGLPTGASVEPKQARDQLLPPLIQQCGVEPQHVECYATGHACGVQALARAVQLVEQQSDMTCLVGAVDTFGDVLSLFAMHEQGRLKNTKSMTGKIAGEAAAFLAVQANGEGVRITGTGVAQEEINCNSDQPCLGLGLAEAIKSAAGGMLTTNRVDLIVCDLNGEVYRGEEWAAAGPKCFAQSPGELTLWHPADCMGDVGAAAAVVNVALAASALQQQVTPRDEILVFGSSEAGLRGALTLQRS